MKGDRKSLGLAALAAFGLFLGIYYWPSIAGAVKTVGGGIGGVGGMLLGVPLASAAYQMLRDCLHRKEAALKDE